MRLRYSALSPFVRKVLVAAIELGLDDQIERVPTDVWADGGDSADNPLGKVPVLVTDDGSFTGSTLICRYLDVKGGGRLFSDPADWKMLQLHALADGIMEAAVARTNETLRRPQEFVFKGYVERQEGKIVRTLDVVEAEGRFDPNRNDIAMITLGCALGYLDLRADHLNWREARPQLTSFHDAFSRRPAMQQTAPKLA